MKTALVTGGAKRIGAEIVRALAEDGWRVLVHYNTSASEAEDLAGSLTASGSVVQTIGCDLANLEATLNLIQECNKLVGPLDRKSVV